MRTRMRVRVGGKGGRERLGEGGAIKVRVMVGVRCRAGFRT